ncbi:MAG TPA: hypothetical protein VMH33_04450 [Solirubrobacterales bacterium]|nr:hypothetical protein [Solirubrobacterales bacterium]
MDGAPVNEIERPRSVWQLLGATFSLYRRFPWLFLVLAAVVVVPYELISLISSQELVHGAARGAFEFFLLVADVALVLPLISALHVHAVDDVREGRVPTVGSAARRGVASLPVLSPTAVISYLGILAGFIALIVPGIFLMLRWAVVAQTATLDATGWRDALYGSDVLTKGRYRHVLAVTLVVFVITVAPGFLLFHAFGRHLTVILFLARTAVSVAVSSFGALAIGLLYFDLRARPRHAEPAPQPVEPPGDPLASTGYADVARPFGWYVDPVNPRRMRYWADGWSEHTKRTPKQTLIEWEELREGR